MNKIPSKPRYERTLKMALEFIIKEGINSLPIDVNMILKRYVVSINTVGEISEKLSIPRKKVIFGKDADVFSYNGLYKVIYNEYIASSARIRWTLMHEIGHIYLGHLVCKASKDDVNLSPYRADFFNPHIHMLSMNKWDIQVRALTPLNILSFS